MTEQDLLNEVEAHIIGSLQNFNELFRYVYVEPEYFIPEFRPMINAMMQSMRENNSVITENIFKHPGVDMNLYMACADIGYNKDKNNFMHLQEFLVEKYKQRKAVEYAIDFTQGNLTFEEFNRVLDKTKKITGIDNGKITKDALLKACASNKNNIWFSRFQKFGGMARIAKHDFVILAGATGNGKTGVAINLARDLSNYYKIVYFNLEMPHERMLQRYIGISSEIPIQRLKKMNELSEDEQNKVNSSINDISHKDNYMISESQTIQSIRSYVAANEGDKHMIVFIDHIGLIGAKGATSYERMNLVAKELRKIGMDYDCTIIGLCQLNRSSNKESKPSLSMLRDSGEIEQSARKVVFVWKDGYDYSLVIEKNDEGPLGIIDIVYDKETQAVYESAGPV